MLIAFWIAQVGNSSVSLSRRDQSIWISHIAYIIAPYDTDSRGPELVSHSLARRFVTGILWTPVFDRSPDLSDLRVVYQVAAA